MPIKPDKKKKIIGKKYFSFCVKKDRIINENIIDNALKYLKW